MSSKTDAPNYRIASDETLRNAWKLSIVEDEPILSDYWTASLDNNIILGLKEKNDYPHHYHNLNFDFNIFALNIF